MQVSWPCEDAPLGNADERDAGVIDQGIAVPVSSEPLNGAPFWLTAGEAAVYAVLHTPLPGTQRDTAVLILPPFGWEEVCSYRARRHWAIDLARAGFPVARIDLPAAGDSPGTPDDPDLLPRWDAAVRSALARLRALPGITRIAVIGIRLGGMLAVRALADGEQIDDIVLWGVPARGRAYLRELRVHSQVVAGGSYEEEDARDSADGSLALTGFILRPQTAAALEAIDLAATELPDLSGHRALLIERDGLGVDRKLTAALSGAGAETKTVPANDYRLLMTDPLKLGTPRESIATTINWLRERAGVAELTAEPALAPLTAPGEDTATFWIDGVKVTERLLSYDSRAGRMVGILTRPTDREPSPVCIVLLAPGRRTGPNRMWVETARRWAALGVQSVRFDVEGFGDSDGDGDVMAEDAVLHTPRVTEGTQELIGRLVEVGIAERFAMVGLCASAYWMFRAAIEDPRIIGITLVNMWAFDYTDRLVAERARARTVEVVRKGMFKRMIKGVLQGWIGMADLRQSLRAFRPSVRRAGSEEQAQQPLIERWLKTLSAHGTDVTLIFSLDEPLYRQIVRFGFLDRLPQWPGVFVEETPIKDHNIRAPWVQALISDRVDAALRRQLRLAP
jgi:pimeloyl-ACP methyl ester carboxylesterase